MNPSPFQLKARHTDIANPKAGYSEVYHHDGSGRVVATFCDPETHRADAEAFMRVQEKACVWRIFKFRFPDDSNVLKLPGGSRPINVGLQEGSVVLWVETPSASAHTGSIEVALVLTGEDLPDGGVYCGTVQRQFTANFVQHCYWRNVP